MPKKDTANAVLGMLSTAGAQTRSTASVESPAPIAAGASPIGLELAAEPRPAATISTLPPTPPPAATQQDPAPRTIRLRADTARQLRAAWLEAKRDDVLLQSQDFASALVEEALAARRRRARAASSS
jgi:hypothetical protein